MDHCGPDQARLFDYLYDLLEEDEHRSLEEHLTLCPACRTALDGARAQQRLLAAAARMEFPAVRFTPPPDVLTLPARPAAQPARRWGRMAAAAVLLLALTGLGSLGTWTWFDYSAARAVQAPYQGAADRVVREIDTLGERLQDARKERDARLAALRQPFKVVVSGPQTVQPGAPNPYRIETLDAQNRRVPAHLSLRVEDEGHRLLAERNDVASTGDYRLDLPANLDLHPGSRVGLRVLARRNGGREELVRASLLLDEPLYVTHLATDRPLYRPGETILFRSLTLERFSLKPPEEDFQLVYKLKDPAGNEQVLGPRLSRVVRSQGGPVVLDGQPLRGLGAGEFQLPDNAPGGEWTLTVSENNKRFPDETRRFLVNKYEKQNLNKELEWSRRSYGPGDEVVAHCRVETADHRQVTCTVTASLHIDGADYGPDGQKNGRFSPIKTDADGKATIRFRLPEPIANGAGTLSVEFRDGANVETIGKPIPIALKRLDVTFYPEGGDLVAGVRGRVYFEVRNTLRKPADLRGRVVDDTGRVVAEGVETFRVPDQPGSDQGTGVFELTPEAGRTYQLKIDEPASIEGKHPLPTVKAGQVALSISTGVTDPGQPIRAIVRSPGRERTLLVGAYCRGRILDHRTVTVPADAAATVELRPAEEVGGVYRVTVFEEQPGDGPHERLRPVAERLVYRVPAQQLRLVARPDREEYVPGDPARVTVTAADEKGRAVPAVALVAVVDRSVLALADEKTAHGMPTHFFLTTEVRRPQDLEHADFLLGPHPKARQALDLLLGTQGWRRFAEQDPKQFEKSHGQDATRLLVSIGESSPPPIDVQQREAERIRQEYEREALQVGARIAKARQDAGRMGTTLEGEAFQQAATRVALYDDLFRRARQEWLPLLGFALLLAALVVLVVGVVRNWQRAAAIGFGALACSALLLGYVVQQVVEDNNQILTVATLLPQKMHELAQVKWGPVPPGPAPGRPLHKLSTGKKGDRLPPLEKDVAPDRGLNAHANQLADAARRLGAEQLRTAQQLRGEGAEVTLPPPPCVVREYAHQREQPPAVGGALGFPGEPLPPAAPEPGQGPGGVRSDFAETLYWNPVLLLPDGKADLGFALSDSVTSYQVAVMGHTLDGRVGSTTATLEARLPLALAPKVPVEVGSADRLDIPVSVANNTAEQRAVDLHVAATGLALADGARGEDHVTVPAGERRRRVFHFRPDVVEGQASLEVRGEARPFAEDRIRRTFAVVPDGFPVAGSHSDVLAKVVAHEVVLPDHWVPGTLRLEAEVYPSALADLRRGLEELLHEPAGCFEQTSSSNYPNLLILNYLKETRQARPEVEGPVLALLDRGYHRLIGFECPHQGGGRQGYEWFGAPDAAHEALTAYGLMEFRDMARVYPVDPAMLERTRQYLLDQRDGHGGFRRSPRALDSFGRAPQDVTNAYIVWALTESGKEDDLARELNALTGQAKQSTDAYFLALVANSLLNRDRAEEAVALLKKVAGGQKDDGHLDAERTSITGSTGRQLRLETTALAVLGWLKANRPNEFNAPVQKAVRWIGQQRSGTGGYGSTQSTVLVLKALTAYARSNRRTVEAGELRLLVGDAVVARTPFGAGAQDTVTVRLPEPEKLLRPGKSSVRVELAGGNNVFPYTLSWSYRTATPPSAADAPVRLATRLDRHEADEGATVHLTVTVENARAEGQGMAVAVVGLPAGLALPDDLKQLMQHAALRNGGTERGVLDFFEVRGRELVLYWRDLAPRQKVEVPVDLICRVPGDYRGPASRAYLYYNGDARCWAEPLRVTIRAGQ